MSRYASLFASLFANGVTRSHRDMTPERTPAGGSRKADPLRYLPPPALAGWSALPERDRRLLEWLVVGELVTAELAATLAYGSLRVAQRRLARLRAYGLVSGFWAANMQRPRGRFAYRLTDRCRADLERLLWANARPKRPPRGDERSTIHHLAVQDVLGTFLRGAHDEVGLAAWLPERICSALFEGYLRPDALAAVRVEQRMILLFLERDAGSERTALLTAKARRFGAVLGSRPELTPVHVGFVTESPRRARSILSTLAATRLRDQPLIWTVTESELAADLWRVEWRSPAGSRLPITQFPGQRVGDPPPTLGRGCLIDPERFGALDERALALLPMLDHFRRRSGL